MFVSMHAHVCMCKSSIKNTKSCTWTSTLYCKVCERLAKPMLTKTSVTCICMHRIHTIASRYAADRGNASVVH